MKIIDLETILETIPEMTGCVEAEDIDFDWHGPDEEDGWVCCCDEAYLALEIDGRNVELFFHYDADGIGEEAHDIDVCLSEVFIDDEEVKVREEDELKIELALSKIVKIPFVSFVDYMIDQKEYYDELGD